MTYFEGISEWPEDKRETLVEWIRAEGLDPNVIRDDGQFSVHNGRVSGNQFVLDDDEKRVVDFRNARYLYTHFNVPQKNPLPEGY